MPEAEAGTPTKATRVIFHFISFHLNYLLFMCWNKDQRLIKKTAQEQKQNTQDFRNERKHTE